jgi:CheY-like chemotaxis protein
MTKPCSCASSGKPTCIPTSKPSTTALKRDELAAIFLDLKLPTVSGLELLQAIRANERTREIPVIVMTSSNTPTDLEKCRELGVFSYVAKPLTFSSFAKAFADTFQALREQKIHAKVD